MPQKRISICTSRSVGSRRGIVVEANVNGFIVTGCTLGGNATLYSAVTQKWGLEIVAGTSGQTIR